MFERPYAQAEPVTLNEDPSAVVRCPPGGMLSALHHWRKWPSQLAKLNG
jgi:hypothetical protein